MPQPLVFHRPKHEFDKDVIRGDHSWTSKSFRFLTNLGPRRFGGVPNFTNSKAFETTLFQWKRAERSIACNNVNWNYLDAILRTKPFGLRLRSWIDASNEQSRRWFSEKWKCRTFFLCSFNHLVWPSDHRTIGRTIIDVSYEC